ncbi:DnaT-like ssDNA-binding domain-containing protein [Serratia ureilytica]|uniref:DnaT-like ssDNA-binding domain-containing protein n=1 Tax=Serratia ureilytica TaxID=300181 RepID=UPI0023614971|nr:DnaT-like ssDNA-binding domain-containing protein [Serratia ureilytica]
MARIRTVKPEFWTDEKVVECSIAARLLFIGLFNFANDKGCLERSPRRIKMQVFPADSMDCEPLLQELITHGLLTEYSVNDVQYLHISGFLKHQKINRPSQTNIPVPPGFNDNSVSNGNQCGNNSPNSHGVLSEDSMSNQGGFTDGKEGKGKDLKDKTPHIDRAGANASPTGGSAPPEFVDESWPDDPAVKFPMTADWQPSPDFRQRAALWGKALSGPELGYTPAELASFQAYWQAEGKAFHQAQWELKFADHLRKQPAAPPAGGGSRRRGSFEPSGNYDEKPAGFS